MQEDSIYIKINALISNEQTDEALEILDKIIEEGNATDITFYLKGNIFRKMNHWQNAINNYTLSIEKNPDSPAVAARKMAIEILNFYNTDMYNH